MIDIVRKEDCSGCSACAEDCPHGCIEMRPDEEGFLFPEVDSSRCVDCGLCDRICPITVVPKDNNVQQVIAAKNSDGGQRFRSSSGGIFRLLAEEVLNNGGVVAGCRFNENMEAEHVVAESREELEALMSSKYVQSDTRGIFKRVRTLLKSGRKVLFSGVPCQVAALRNFLFKPYDNLMTVDILCHGVPSPKVFKEYVAGLEHRYGAEMKSYSFRWKEKSWKRLYVNAAFANNKRHFLYAGYDSYMQLFLSDRLQRSSCFHCPYNMLHRPGDITLGDFWGIGKTHYDFDDNKGVSMVLVNNARGKELWDRIAPRTVSFDTDIESAVAGNRVLVDHLPDQSRRDEFYREYVADGFAAAVAKYSPETPLYSRLFHNFMRWGLDIVRKIKRQGY